VHALLGAIEFEYPLALKRVFPKKVSL